MPIAALIAHDLARLGFLQRALGTHHRIVVAYALFGQVLLELAERFLEDRRTFVDRNDDRIDRLVHFGEIA